MIELTKNIISNLLYPFGKERVGLTVAENKAPYFIEVLANFGYLFWTFFLGMIILFYESLKEFKLKEKLKLNFFFLKVFFFGRVFFFWNIFFLNFYKG